MCIRDRHNVLKEGEDERTVKGRSSRIQENGHEHDQIMEKVESGLPSSIQSHSELKSGLEITSQEKKSLKQSTIYMPETKEEMEIQLGKFKEDTISKKKSERSQKSELHELDEHKHLHESCLLYTSRCV